MRMLHLEKLEDLQSAGEWLTPGDCVEVDSLSALTGNVKELLAALVMINDRAADFVSLQEGIDTREGQGASFFALCRVLSEAECFSRRRDGIDKAKEEGRYKGRKPIFVDESLLTLSCRFGKAETLLPARPWHGWT